MLADFFQGVLFTRFCNVILGDRHIDSLDIGPTPVPEEHVGREQANGCRTESDDDGFILVIGRRKCKPGIGYEAVARVPVDMSGNEWTRKEKLIN